MSKTLVDGSSWAATVTVPTDGDAATAASVEAGFQNLADRTAVLNNYGKSGGTGFPHALRTVNTTSDMKALATPAAGDTVLVLSSPLSATSAAGVYVYSASQTSGPSDNSPYYFVSTSGSGGSWGLAAVGGGLVGARPGLATLNSSGRLEQTAPFYTVYYATAGEQSAITISGSPQTLTNSTTLSYSGTVGDIVTANYVVQIYESDANSAATTYALIVSISDGGTTYSYTAYQSPGARKATWDAGARRWNVPVSFSRTISGGTQIITAGAYVFANTPSCSTSVFISSASVLAVRP